MSWRPNDWWRCAHAHGGGGPSALLSPIPRQRPKSHPRKQGYPTSSTLELSCSEGRWSARSARTPDSLSAAAFVRWRAARGARPRALVRGRGYERPRGSRASTVATELSVLSQRKVAVAWVHGGGLTVSRVESPTVLTTAIGVTESDRIKQTGASTAAVLRQPVARRRRGAESRARVIAGKDPAREDTSHQVLQKSAIRTGRPPNATVHLQPKEIERAERAYNRSAVCCSACWAAAS